MGLIFKNCEKCVVGQQYKNIATFSDGSKGNVISGGGSNKPLLVVVGDCAQIADYKNGIPFSSESGVGIKKAIEHWIGINDNHIFYTYLIKCLCPDNKKFHKEALETCKAHLEEQLSILNPLMVLLVGSEPAKVMLELDNKTKISNIKGKLITKDYNYFTVWSTGYVKRNKNKFEEWSKDFKRARYEFDSLLLNRFPQVKNRLSGINSSSSSPSLFQGVEC